MDIIQHLTTHIDNITNKTNDFIENLSGTSEEEKQAFIILAEFYETIAEHMRNYEKMTFVKELFTNLKEEHIKNQEESKKKEPMAGFDSIRPGQKKDDSYCSKCGGLMVLQNDDTIYPSLPHKYKHVCSVCGHIKFTF